MGEEMNKKILWHNLPWKEIVGLLSSDSAEGLPEKEIKARQQKFGLNELPEERPLSRLRIFLEQLQSPLIFILIIAGVITLILEEYTDAVVIFAAIFLNTTVGFIQENKASQTLSELKKIVKHNAEVLRGGCLRIIDAGQLVPGDIIILNPGDRVPADARIIECRDLKINEMALTGEWLAAKKNPEILPKETPLADRDNMVYMGCTVEDGRGKAIVTATGIQTEIGGVAAMLKETKEEATPYQKKLAHFSRIVGIIIAVICFGIFIEGMLTGGEFVEMFTTAVAVAVAAIPEGLPVAMTVILALGMTRILKKKGLVRRLASAETLGSTSVICSDKTATLTEGKMTVNDVIPASALLAEADLSAVALAKADEGDKSLTLRAAVLTSEAFIENPEAPKEKWILRGRPTDRALLEAGIEAGIDRKREFERKKIAETPFNPINKFAAALYEENGEKTLYACGAPEKILERCAFKNGEKLEKQLEELALKGLRIVASASKAIRITNLNELRIENEIKDLTFAGFITLKDPIRPEVKQAMEVCRQAGMRPIIVTGDHKLTARVVAEDLGFKIKKENILEGTELDKLANEEFEKILDKIQIYARVEPRHKMRIIRAWQERGEVVAMTGDGINDAPALKKADIGVALGSGTEVAKEASDLILLNDSFSIIVAAVEEGRAILDNIRKVITYIFADGFTEVLLVGVSILAGTPLPISAVQILWVNLIEDGLPDLTLAFEQKERDIMKRKPTGQKSPLLTREMKKMIFTIGFLTNLLLLGLFFWLWKQNHDIFYIRTMIFSCLTIDSLFYVFSCKSLRRNLWHINPFSNKFLVAAFGIGILMLVFAIYLPGFQILLKTVPLGFNDWLIILGLGVTELILIETAKWHFIIKNKDAKF